MSRAGTLDLADAIAECTCGVADGGLRGEGPVASSVAYLGIEPALLERIVEAVRERLDAVIALYD
ncbi:MAG: hypothetical protein ACE5IL_16755 [Myxococcota bacterium]